MQIEATIRQHETRAEISGQGEVDWWEGDTRSGLCWGGGSVFCTILRKEKWGGETVSAAKSGMFSLADQYLPLVSM